MFTKKDIKKEVLKTPLGKDPLIMYAWDLLTDEMFQREWNLFDFKVEKIRCKPFASGQKKCDFTFRLNLEDALSEEVEDVVKMCVTENIITELRLMLHNHRHLLELLELYAEPLYRLKYSAEELNKVLLFIYDINWIDYNRQPNESIDDWANRIDRLYKSFTPPPFLL